MTPDDIRQENVLFVHRGDPRLWFRYLRYRTGERVKLGDIVMEPVNAHERYGVVDEFYDPDSSDAASIGFPQGCFQITWCRGPSGDHLAEPDAVLVVPEGVMQQDVLIFIRRSDSRHDRKRRKSG